MLWKEGRTFSYLGAFEFEDQDVGVSHYFLKFHSLYTKIIRGSTILIVCSTYMFLEYEMNVNI